LIAEPHTKSKNLVQEKSFEFAVSIVKYYKQLKTQSEFAIANQLLRSGTSVGANIEEALGGSSKKDFINKMTIALKEARESKYWLRLIYESGIDKNVAPLLTEANSLVNILSKIVKTSKDDSKKTE
jgi:four helix bundle protein